MFWFLFYYHNIWVDFQKSLCWNTKNHLLNEYGIFTKVSAKGPTFTLKQRYTKDAEKARVNVTKHLRKAIGDIKKRLPSLGVHLEECIKTGNKFRYEIGKNKPMEYWSIHWNN